MIKLYNIFNKILNVFLTKIRILMSLNILYKYDNFYIVLPPDHLLPLYQKKHRKYDMFLPHIAKYIEPQETVIDIGSNCGDTLASMVSVNHNISFFCIEADEVFFDFLTLNISRMKKIFPFLNVISCKSLVGNSTSTAILQGKGGTKHAILDGNITNINKILKYESLDELVDKYDIKNIKLIKSDVDGYDYDIINSSMNVLNENSPILFFECMYENKNQLNGYVDVVKRLNNIGYKKWIIFDNYGDIILETVDINIIYDLINYVWRQNNGISSRTIYYFDILTCCDNNVDMIDKVVNDYINI